MKIELNKTSASLLVLLLLSILARLPGLLTPTLWFDEGMVAIQSLRVMKGDFPVFFYGQPFMGSLEAYLNAVIFHCFEPSIITLKILPNILSIFFLLLIYFLTKKILGGKTAFIAGLLIALPSSELMRWSYEARSHYNFTLVFGTLLLILAQRIVYSGTSRGEKAFLFGLSGLTAGLGWWNNFLIIAYILPAAFILFLSNKKVIFSKNFLLVTFLFFSGSLPLWIFNLLNHHSMSGVFYWADLSVLLANFKGVFTGAMPILLGLRTTSFDPKDFGPAIPLLGRHSDMGWIVLLGGIYAVSGIAFFLKYRKGVKSVLLKFRLTDTKGGELLLLLFAANIGINLVSGYGNQVGLDSRYLLPLLTCLPIFLASFLVDLQKKSRILTVFFLVTVLFYNVCQNIRHNHWIIFNEAKLAAYREDVRQEVRLQDFLITNGFNYNYADHLAISEKKMTLNSNEALIFSHIYQEGCLKYANKVDGSRRASYIFPAQNRLFEENLKAIGGSCRKVVAPGDYFIYTDFSPPGPYRMLPRDLWTATSNVHPSEARNAFDSDISTGWSTRSPQKKGTYFLLDLGRMETVGKISYIPAIYYQNAGGYAVALSADNKHWQVVSEVQEYKGPIFWSGPHPMTKVRHARIETVFPPQPCRFLKIRLLHDSPDTVWSINELFLFGPEDGVRNKKSLIPHGTEVDSLMSFLTDRKVHYVYADHWLSAVIRVKSDWKIQTMVSNFFTGENGQDEPPTQSLERSRLDKNVALVMAEKNRDLEEILLESKHSYRFQEIGPFIVYYDFSRPAKPLPLSVDNWSVSSNANPQEAGKAIDQKPATRWTSGKPQEPGMFYQIDLKKVQSVRGCTLDAGKWIDDYPRSLKLFSSVDGHSWQEIKTTAESGLYWTGETLVKMTGPRFFFSPIQMRYLRLVQEGRDPVYYWSISELELF